MSISDLNSFVEVSNDLVKRLSSIISGEESEEVILDVTGKFHHDLKSLVDDFRKKSKAIGAVTASSLVYYSVDYTLSLRFFNNGDLKNALTALKDGTSGITRIRDEYR